MYYSPPEAHQECKHQGNGRLAGFSMTAHEGLPICLYKIAKSLGSSQVDGAPPFSQTYTIRTGTDPANAGSKLQQGAQKSDDKAFAAAGQDIKICEAFDHLRRGREREHGARHPGIGARTWVLMKEADHRPAPDRDQNRGSEVEREDPEDGSSSSRKLQQGARR